MAISGDSSDPGSIFRQYIVGSLQMSLSRVNEAGVTLPESTRVQALHVLDHAFRIAEAWPDTRALLLAMSPQMEQGGNWREWVTYLKEGIVHSRPSKDQDAEAAFNHHLGILYRLLGEYAQARTCFVSSVVHFKRQNDTPQLAQTLNQLAYLYCLQSQYTQSGNIVCVVERLLGETDTELANCHLIRGMIAYDYRNWHDAVSHFQHALRIWERIGNKREVARNLRNLGAAWNSIGQHQKSVTYYSQALILFQEVDDPVLHASIKMNLGIAYFSQGQNQKARELYNEIEPTFHQVQAKLPLARLQTNQAQTHRKLHEWEMAKHVCISSIKLWQELGNTRWAVNAMDELGLIYKEQGEQQKAVETFEKALKQLEQIEGSPNYQRLFELLERHLEETKKDIEHQQI